MFFSFKSNLLVSVVLAVRSASVVTVFKVVPDKNELKLTKVDYIGNLS